MSDQIFVSHSQEDEDLLLELDKVFGKVGLKQYRASFEDQMPPVSQNLNNEITRSVGMFVVLGRRAQAKTHTMIWIGWEAGVAIHSGIPVWIVEDIHSEVTEPIPSFTDYVLWDSDKDEQKRILRDVLEEEFVERDVPRQQSGFQILDTLNRGWGSSRNSAKPRNSKVTDKMAGVQCPYDDCGEIYTIRFEDAGEFNCPSCRQAISIEEHDDLYDDF